MPYLDQGICITDATIPISTAVTGQIALNGSRVLAIQMSAGWDAAALTFQGSLDGVTFMNLHDSGGTEISYTTAAGRIIVLSPLALVGLAALIIRSGTSGTPVNQTAARTLRLLTRREV